MKDYKGKLPLRVSPALHAKLDELAHRQGLSINRCIEAILEAQVQLQMKELGKGKRLSEDKQFKKALDRLVDEYGPSYVAGELKILKYELEREIP